MATDHDRIRAAIRAKLPELQVSLPDAYMLPEKNQADYLDFVSDKLTDAVVSVLSDDGRCKTILRNKERCDGKAGHAGSSGLMRGD